MTPLIAVDNAIAADLEKNLGATQKPIPVFKLALQGHRQQQEDKFHAGEDAGLLIQQNACFMDEVMRLAWGRLPRGHVQCRCLLARELFSAATYQGSGGQSTGSFQAIQSLR